MGNKSNSTCDGGGAIKQRFSPAVINDEPSADTPGTGASRSRIRVEKRGKERAPRVIHIRRVTPELRSGGFLPGGRDCVGDLVRGCGLERYGNVLCEICRSVSWNNLRSFEPDGTEGVVVSLHEAQRGTFIMRVSKLTMYESSTIKIYVGIPRFIPTKLTTLSNIFT